MKKYVLFLMIAFLFLNISCTKDDDILQNEVVVTNSPGQPGSPSLKKGSTFLTARFYYASNDTSLRSLNINQPDGTQREIPIFGNPNESIKTNAFGDKQVLFYDYYAPQKKDSKFNKYTVIFYHGGGFQSGAANDVCTAYHIEEWLKMGFHGVIIGYRKGWFGDGSESPGGEAEVTANEGNRFEVAAEMALEDSKQAWSHFNKNTVGHGRWFSGQSTSKIYVDHDQSLPYYIAIGNSAGGSLVTRTIHTSEYPDADMQVFGAIAGFGTHKETESILPSHNNVPTIVVAGLFDDLSPFYSNPIFYDSDMPLTKGTKNFYDELINSGYKSRMLISAQKGHGWASFGKDPSESYCGKSIPDFSIDPSSSDINTMADHYAISFFFKDNALSNYQHFRFFKNAKHSSTALYPIVDDEGTLYEQIGISNSQKANILTIDPSFVGLDLADHLYIDGFYYGNDSLNELGDLNIPSGFRYEPFQTEFEKALENGLKPSHIKAKYDF